MTNIIDNIDLIKETLEYYHNMPLKDAAGNLVTDTDVTTSFKERTAKSLAALEELRPALNSKQEGVK